MRCLLVLLLVACAPSVDGPVERQRAVDASDATALAAQLAQLPGTTHASVTLHRPVRDPLSTAAPAQAAASVLLVVDDRTDRTATTATATQLVRAAAPEISAPAIVVVVGEHRPALAKVGPFVVAADSAGLLKASLAAGLVVIIALAAWLALGQRRGNSAQ